METSLDDLQKLVDDEVPESTQLDYKRDAYPTRSPSRKDPRDELRKDVVALANANGGLLVLGVADSDGRPTKVLGLDGSLESHEGHIRNVLSSRIEPWLERIEIVEVPGDNDRKGCLLVVVPPSSRQPHAVRPHNDDDALKFARRVGRHTEWLSESQVAELYRSRFSAIRSQRSRLQELETAARNALAKRAWILSLVVPDEPGDFPVSREAVELIHQWWFGRRIMDVIPNIPARGGGPPEIGPQQIILAGRDATSVPTGTWASFHADGASAICRELDPTPGGNPGIYLDHLVGHVLEGVELGVAYATEVAATGGLGALQVLLHFPEQPGLPIHAWDPSWSNPSRLPGTPQSIAVQLTLDLDAVTQSASEVVAVAAIAAGRLAQYFGEPDARYLSPNGEVRVQQFSARDRDYHVLPRTTQHGLPIVGSL